jgi:4-amino-4-deoxy-L-arabinose transferase-like glycosyltransferase
MKLLLNNSFFAFLFIAVLAGAMFIPFIGNCHLFDWDEINFAECAREMVVTGNYSDVQLNYRPFWEKPPFFIWLQALSMNLFGVNEFAARFPNAICGVVTLCLLFVIGKRTNSPAFGLNWALVYAGTLLPHFYFKSGIIDPWFNLFIFLSFYQFILHFNNPTGGEGYRSAIFAGLFLGLAVLTKGPAAILIIAGFVAVFWIIHRFKRISSLKFILVFILSLLLTGGSWFIIEMARGNFHVIEAFIDYQLRLFKTEDSEHGGPFFYHFIVLLVGCFPTSLFMIMSSKASGMDTPYQKLIKQCMFILFFVVLLIFSLVKTKIVHYSSMCYLPLTYLGTYAIFKIYHGEYVIKKWVSVLFVILTTVIGLLFTLIGFAEQIKSFLLGRDLIKDPFAAANLEADVHWQGWEWVLGISFMAVSLVLFYFFRKGRRNYVFYLYAFFVAFIIVSVNILTPKIEKYSQGAAIEFYKSVADKHAYLETIGFKSYAYLFYSKKLPEQNQNPDGVAMINKTLDDLEKQGYSRLSSYSIAYATWMQYGQIDKPAYFVCKINDTGILNDKRILKMYSKNGFVFCVRFPSSNTQ